MMPQSPPSDHARSQRHARIARLLAKADHLRDEGIRLNIESNRLRIESARICARATNLRTRAERLYEGRIDPPQEGEKL